MKTDFGADTCTMQNHAGRCETRSAPAFNVRYERGAPALSLSLSLSLSAATLSADVGELAPEPEHGVLEVVAHVGLVRVRGLGFGFGFGLGSGSGSG